MSNQNPWLQSNPRSIRQSWDTLEHLTFPMDHSLVVAKGLKYLDEAISHGMQGHQRQSSEELWQNVVN